MRKTLIERLSEKQTPDHMEVVKGHNGVDHHYQIVCRRTGIYEPLVVTYRIEGGDVVVWGDESKIPPYEESDSTYRDRDGEL